MSPDEKFEEIGSKSGIKYAANFAAYKQILDKGLANPRNKAIHDLFALWNRSVFTKELRPSATPVPNPDEDEPDPEDLLRRMQEIDSSGDENDNEPSPYQHDINLQLSHSNLHHAIGHQSHSGSSSEAEDAELPPSGSVPRFARSSAIIQNSTGMFFLLNKPSYISHLQYTDWDYY